MTLLIHWQCLGCRRTWWAPDGINGPCVCGHNRTAVIDMIHPAVRGLVKSVRGEG